MELGFFTMPLHPPGSNPAQTMDDDLEQLVTLDRLGYKEAWIGEHFTAEWENVPAPDLLIAKALGMTPLASRCAELRRQLDAAPAGYPDGLTRREVEVLSLVARGLSNVQIAEELVLSPRTVEGHITNLYAKIGANGRAGAATYAMIQHLVELEVAE